MAMRRTEGFIKAQVEVFYCTNTGDKIHMMSFQLATGRISNETEYARVIKVKEDCEADNSKMQEYIKAALASVRANDYDLILEFGLSC